MSSTCSPHVRGCLCDFCARQVRDDFVRVLADEPSPYDKDVGSKVASNFLGAWRDAVLEGEALKRAKASLAAVPSGLVSSSLTRRRTNAKGKKKGKKNGLTDIVYNTVANRPQLRRTMRTPQIVVEMAVQQTAFTTSTVATVFYGNYLTLASFSNYTEYTSLFDQYKFEEFEVWIEPFETQSSVQALAGTFSSCIDVDDANTPTSIAGVQDHQGCLVTNGEAGHYHRWKPHMAVAVYSGTFTSFANAPANWIDSASPGVQHYGIKSAITATTNAVAYSIQIKALVSFRSSGI